MSLKETLTQLTELRDDIQARRKLIFPKYFAEESKIVFAAHDKLESFSWTQYTPYFADGDPCEFSVNRDGFDLVVDGQSHDDVYFWQREPNADDEHFAIFPLYQELKEFLKDFDDAALEDMFGDHCKVTVTREGVETTDHEHD